MQVCGGISPQWPEMHLLSRGDISIESLHGLKSGQLHLHIYAAQPHAEQGEPSSCSQPAAEPSHSSKAGQTGSTEPSSNSRLPDVKTHGSSQPSKDLVPGRRPRSAKEAFPNGTTDTKWRRSDTQAAADSAETHRDGMQRDNMSFQSHPGECSSAGTSCELILAADIDLDSLEHLPDILGVSRTHVYQQLWVIPAATMLCILACMVISSLMSSYTCAFNLQLEKEVHQSAAETEREGLVLQTLTIACCRRIRSSWA